MEWRCAAPVITLVLALAIPAQSARAENWQQKLEMGRDAAPLLHPGPVGEAPGGGATGAFAYQSSYRAGYNSNANADFFDPVGSAFAVTDQNLVVVKRAGKALWGVQLRGSIEDAVVADDTEYGATEARTSIAVPLPHDRAITMRTGYFLEDDRGFRSHDLGADITLRGPVGQASHFVTVTANRITHDPLDFPEGPFDLGDNDRWRFGFETGFDIPVMPGVTATLAGGVVEVSYLRQSDLAGVARSSTSGFGRFGLTIGGNGPVTGSFGAMLFNRLYEDPRFDTETVMLGDADIAWRINERTELGFQYLGDLEETPVYGARNELTAIAAVTLTRQINDDLFATVAVYEQGNDFLETLREDTTRGAALELTRQLTPNLSLALAGEYETGATNLTGDTADVWKVSAGFNFSYAGTE